MSEQGVIFTGVLVYVILMVVIGVYAARRTHSSAEFVVAGRSLPLWLCTATIMATWFGGAIMMGGAGAAYSDGMLGVIADPFGASVCLFLSGLFFVRIFRRLKFFSFIEFTEQRFGRLATLVTAAGALMSSLFWVASMLVAFGLIFESLTGVPLTFGIIGGAIVIVAYTSLGGMLAVALTDFVQIIIVAVGLVILLVAVVVDNGGWGEISVRIPADTWRMIPFEHTGEHWLNYLRAWLIFGLADIASQSLLQRAMSARTERVAQNSFYLAGLGYLGFAMVPVLLGIIASVTMPGLDNAEAVIPALALEHLHPVAIAIFVGALLSAIMSSCDSALLASATIVSTNLLPFFRREPSDHLTLLVARWALPVAGVIAVVGALNAQVVFNTMLDANMLLLAAVIAPFILGIWWRKANRAGALAGMGAGLVAWWLTSVWFVNLPGDLIGLGASLAAMFIVTPLTQAIDPPRPMRDRDGKPVDLDDRLGVLGLSGRQG